MLIVSFYSYKGGSGRSTTSWNTIQRLVNLLKPTAKEPFVIVDTDTESAGSTFLYNADEVFFRDNKYASVQKRMTTGDTNYDGSSGEEKEKFFRGMYPIGTFFGLKETEENTVLLIGANTDRTSNWGADVSGETKDSKNQMENFNNNITKASRKCGAKALFFDTPTGVQFLARRSVQESKIVVCCMRPTSQFREGTKKQLIDFIKYDIEKDEEGKRKYILTPTVICAEKEQKFTLNGIEYVYPNEAKKRIIREFGRENMHEDKKIDQAFKDNVILDMLEPTPAAIKQQYPESEDDESVFGIPEIRRFKWFEACLGKLSDHERTPNDEMGINRYEYLAQTILKYCER